jgi:K+-transporting ATPase ATPase C chain
MKKQTAIAVKFLLVMTVLTGIIYPLVMTGVAQLCFKEKANGSLVMKDGKIIGSSLIGQRFDSAAYFWSRPSAIGYNPLPSGASNYGPTSDTLKKQVTVRRMAFAANNSLPGRTSVPKEMIFASGSGLDPHISPEAAMLQLERVSSARKFTESQKLKLKQLITDQTEGPQYYLFGEPRVNVFELNLALENIR